jgi:hypothetical protein
MFAVGRSSYKLLPFALAILVSPLSLQSALCDVLHGGVQEEGAATRLARPVDNTSGGNSAATVPFRIERPMPAPPIGGGLKGLVDTQAFNTPLRANAAQDNPNFGLLKPTEFNNLPNSKFDLGADRNSRELTLAWEAWHHQISKEIYRRWSDVASVPGSATLRITVSKNHAITPVILRTSGNAEFDHVLLATVFALSGNPGLSFPAKSERNSVTFEADYVAATDIQPGFSWVKNDYEHVQQNY